MHPHLTDRLTCPRCGPDFGLILRVDRQADGRVADGALGCPNCRDAFPVRAGFADLRAPPRGALVTGRAGAPGDGDAAEAARIRALLGLAGGPGIVALVGGPAREAARIASEDSDLHVVAIDADAAAWPEAERVSRMVAAPGMPFRTRALRGACVDGALGAGWVAEAARTVAPGCRLMVAGTCEGTDEAIVEAGLTTVASDAGTVVAARG